MRPYYFWPIQLAMTMYIRLVLIFILYTVHLVPLFLVILCIRFVNIHEYSSHPICNGLLPPACHRDTINMYRRYSPTGDTQMHFGDVNHVVNRVECLPVANLTSEPYENRFHHDRIPRFNASTLSFSVPKLI